MLPRLRWNTREQQQVYDILSDYLRDSSSLVKTFAMQALADLTRQAPKLRPAVLRRLLDVTAHGTPAMCARGQKLVANLLSAGT